MKGNFLGTILKILSTVLLIISTGLSAATAYIVFAPDDMWKPFYLVYAFPDEEHGRIESVPASASSSGHSAPASSTGSSSSSTSGKSSTSVPVSSSGKVAPGSGLTVPMGAQIINLAEPTGKRYIRVSVVLEFAPSASYAKMNHEEKQSYVTSFNQELDQKKPIINDIIISLISQKTFQALYTSEGKETLRKEILTKVNEKLREPEVIAVYFTEFVVD